MRFLANENMPAASIHRLRSASYEVASIIEDSPGATDRVILSRAHAEHRVILTFDRDYGELIYRYHQLVPSGVVYFRFVPQSPEEPAERLIELLATGRIALEGQFTIIERGWVRQRPLPR